MCRPSHRSDVLTTPFRRRHGLLGADRWFQVVLEVSPRLMRSNVDRFSARERRIGYCDVKSFNWGKSPYALRRRLLDRAKEKSFHRFG
jgi:hypothetical protein